MATKKKRKKPKKITLTEKQFNNLFARAYNYGLADYVYWEALLNIKETYKLK
jgi:hypothetical protein